MIDDELRTLLTGMGERLNASISGFETRLEQRLVASISAVEKRVEARLDQTEKRMEERLIASISDAETRMEARFSERLTDTETKLLSAFYSWAPTMEIRQRGISTAVNGFEERPTLAEERLGKLERNKLNSGDQR